MEDSNYHLPKVFKVFKRLHTNSAYPGTGIGLSICEKIVAYHSGNIRVESIQGDGAVFYFTIQ